MSPHTLSRRALLVAATALAAFSLSSTAPAQAIDDAPATGTLSVWFGGADGEKLPPLLEAFEKANPDLKVEVTAIPSDQFDAKLMTAIAAGTVPDLVRLYSQSITGLIATGGFAPVPDGLVSKGDFYPSAFDIGVLDGVTYAVPFDAYATTFQYRKDLAEKAGLAAPKTWDEFKSFAKALQANGAKWGIGMDVGYDIYNAQGLNEYVHQAGGSLLNADNTAWTINSEANVKALEFWGSFFAEGLASPDGPKFLDTVPWFTSGDIASKDIGPWFEGWLKDANGADWVKTHLASVPMPAGAAGSVSALGSGNLAVLKDAKNPDAAWKLLRYLSKPETQLAWYNIFGALPAVKAAWSDPVIAGNPLLDAQRTALETAVGNPPVPTWGQVGTYLGQQMERVARGQATAKEVLDEVQSFAEGLGTGN